jgi:hypothetical protein
MLFKGPGSFKIFFKIGGNVDELTAYRLIPLTPTLFFHFTLPLSQFEHRAILDQHEKWFLWIVLQSEGLADLRQFVTECLSCGLRAYVARFPSIFRQIFVNLRAKFRQPVGDLSQNYVGRDPPIYGCLSVYFQWFHNCHVSSKNLK